MHVNLFDPWTSRFHILFADLRRKSSEYNLFDATFSYLRVAGQPPCSLKIQSLSVLFDKGLKSRSRRRATIEADSITGRARPMWRCHVVPHFGFSSSSFKKWRLFSLLLWGILAPLWPDQLLYSSEHPSASGSSSTSHVPSSSSDSYFADSSSGMTVSFEGLRLLFASSPSFLCFSFFRFFQALFQSLLVSFYQSRQFLY